ncbi:DUF2254 domain-containing protein [Arthrobacter halodurans]|uniref:DUF2254 domain-containing protein n=1 Tax=Arthrobacter halodurans TaxID=516699 RepID=A0ABV4USQ4_9MICC
MRRNVFTRTRQALRSELWPVPTLAVVAAIALGVALPQLDAALDGRTADSVSRYLFGGGPEAARSVLESIAGSLITVTSLTFSLTVVTLQLASSQFSPRLLRTFTGDRFVHVTLALFLATFSYALTVLRTVRTAPEAGQAFVPEISVTFAFVLAVASVLALVLFLAHLTREIRVETMMMRVHAETNSVMRHAYPEDAASGPGPVPSRPPAGTDTIEAEKSGFLTSVDTSAIRSAAREAGAVVAVDRGPGSSLVRGTPFATFWPADGRLALAADDAERLRRAVNAAIGTGPERTAAEDVGFGLRQLADVAAKALSPGINDPTTAVHALGHVSDLLCRLAERRVGPLLVADDDGGGGVRVVVSRPGFAELLDLGVAQARQYGIDDPDVAARILELLREVAWCDRSGSHTAALRDQLARTREAMAAAAYGSAERGRLEALGGAVGDALRGPGAGSA